MTTPVAPWPLSGECMVALARSPVRLGELPLGLSPMAGRVLVVAARYDASPVGRYTELAIGEPARLGARPGWCFTTVAVSSQEARMGGRLNWGFPKELAALEWSTSGDERVLRWPERDVVVRGVVSRVAFPLALPMRALQRRNDGPVLVPSVLRGLGHLARVSVEAPAGDPLSPLVGHHRGLDVGTLRFTVRPARHPIGLASTFRAPLRAPEPALSLLAPGD